MSPVVTPLQATGFLLASYAVIGNDALQTLGPFLAANRGRVPRFWQALFLAAVLVAVLLLGWLLGEGDPAWGRLESFALPERFGWPDLIPALAVLALTKWGAPVSTSFLVLTAFSPANLPALLLHSLLGYAIALVLGMAIYALVPAAIVVLAAIVNPGNSSGLGQTSTAGPAPAAEQADPGHEMAGQRFWLVMQWVATGWLWSQWLIQDLANLYIYLPRRITGPELAASLAVLCLGVCLLTAEGGGPIQRLFSSKSGSEDPRATALVSALYGLILFSLGRWSSLPLSTTWVFLGLLAGRELALAWQGRRCGETPLAVSLGTDLFKAGLGLAVSLAVALMVPWLKAIR